MFKNQALVQTITMKLKMKNPTIIKPKTAGNYSLRTRLQKQLLVLGLALVTCTPIANSTPVTASINKPKRICLAADVTDYSTWQPEANASLVPAQIAKRVLQLMLETIAREV